jgi:hypothetical protein
MVLNRENNRVRARVKCVISNRNASILKLDLRSESVAMVNNRLTVVSVPTIHFDASATSLKDLNVLLRGGGTRELMALQIRIMG